MSMIFYCKVSVQSPCWLPDEILSKLTLQNEQVVLFQGFYCNKFVVSKVVACTRTVKKQILTILLVVTCFLGGVVSVTDKEFEVRTV